MGKHNKFIYETILYLLVILPKEIKTNVKMMKLKLHFYLFLENLPAKKTFFEISIKEI